MGYSRQKIWAVEEEDRPARGSADDYEVINSTRTVGLQVGKQTGKQASSQASRQASRQEGRQAGEDENLHKPPIKSWLVY
ncbi:hypothetical protein M0802_000365 [Mischocyttarus mexicanus]|nr:hypothetical protein M0802_000365 [Mischocyttarus mexicanus]